MPSLSYQQADAIQAAIDVRGWTRGELSKRLNWLPSKISGMLNRIQTLSQESLDKILAQLQLDPVEPTWGPMHVGTRAKKQPAPTPAGSDTDTPPLTAADVDAGSRCPVCNESAYLDVYRSTRLDKETETMETWEVTLYRCPNAQIGRSTDRFGLPKKQILGRHPICKVERKLEEATVPIISPELRERAIAARKSAGLTVKQFAQTVPTKDNYLSQVLSLPGVTASNDLLLKIERATEKLERKLQGDPLAPVEEAQPEADATEAVSIPVDLEESTWPGKPDCPIQQARTNGKHCPSADNAQCNEDCPCQDRSPILIEDEAAQWYTPIDRLDQLTTAMQSVEQRLFTLDSDMSEAKACFEVDEEAWSKNSLRLSAVEEDCNGLAKNMEKTCDCIDAISDRMTQLEQRLEQIEDEEPEIDAGQLVRVELAGGDLLEQAIAILRLVPSVGRKELLDIVDQQEQLERLQAKFRANLVR